MKNILVLILSSFLIITTWNVIGPERTSLHARAKKLVSGGTSAELGEIPYQVFLREEDEAFCGGIILSKDIILTAAHCFDGVSDDFEFEVVAGTLEFQASQLPERAQRRLGNHRVIHPDYYKIGNFTVNDVAIVRVSEPFVFNENVKNINLPQRNAPYPIGAAKVSGWGPMMEGQQLNIAELELLSRKECAKHLFTRNESEDWDDKILDKIRDKILDKILCARCDSQGRVEEGDSGGALTKDGVVIGIVSVGIDDRRLEFFTRVSQYVDWINEKSGHVKDEL